MPGGAKNKSLSTFTWSRAAAKRDAGEFSRRFSGRHLPWADRALAD